MGSSLLGTLLSAAALAVACVASLACGGVSFEAETRVFADGRVERRALVAGSLDRQELPPGGIRGEREVAGVEGAEGEPETEETYEVVRRYARGEPIDSDFSRRSENGAASNRISLRVESYGIARVFEYEEVFEREGWQELEPRFRALLRDTEGPWITGLSGLIAERWSGKPRGDIEAGMRAVGGPLSWSLSEGEAASQEAYVAALCEKLEPPPGARRACTDAITATFDDDAAIEALDLPIAEPLWDLYAGPFEKLDDARYRSSLLLPGRVLSHDAEERVGNVLAWEFDPRGRFHVEMHARSILWLPFLHGDD